MLGDSRPRSIALLSPSVGSQCFFTCIRGGTSFYFLLRAEVNMTIVCFPFGDPAMRLL
jgi:hypothetical protein